MKKVTSLNGYWKFTPVHDQKPTNNHNVIESKLPLYAYPLLNRADWEDVSVPGVWQKYAEKYSIYEGVCWFYREFDLEEVIDSSFVNLVFKGVNYRADVYINGEYAGWHESAYTEFSMDISKFVKNGKNCIAVQVDNRPLIVKWPNDWGYGVYGGIHRDVFVEVYNDTYITDIEVTPDYDAEKKKGILYISGQIKGGLPSSVSVKLADDNRIINCKDGKLSEKFEYEGISPWSPENPELYNLSVSIGNYVYKECRIGFRCVQCRDSQFLLNGEKAHFNGACYVYDSPKYGLVMAREQLEEDLLKMKEANINAIRTHYPMSDDFYELCDEMGFMVWIEPNIYCSKPKQNEVNTVFKQEEFVAVAVSMTEEMIKGARQFASVVIYGIGNECNTDHPEALSFFETIAETVRTQDETRPVGYASFYGLVGNIGHLIDVMGVNSYCGWYDVISKFDIADKLDAENGMVKIREADISSLHTMLADVKKILPKGTPILLTEFGADSVPKYYSSACELWSENYHAKVVKSYIEAAKLYREVAGTFVFAFTDYLDPSKPLNGRWNGYNLKGMLTYDRQYKLPYYALQEAYSKK